MMDHVTLSDSQTQKPSSSFAEVTSPNMESKGTKAGTQAVSMLLMNLFNMWSVSLLDSLLLLLRIGKKGKEQGVNEERRAGSMKAVAYDTSSEISGLLLCITTWMSLTAQG